MEGTVSIPYGYFLKMAKHDYSNWKKALPREFYQNSIDAGATVIKVSVNKEPRMIEISDDGCGMSLDTIQNKLLVLGGSKKASGSVGAFGKAKELLFFSWPKWEILTRGLRLEGKGPEYSLNKVESDIQGVIARVWIPEDEDLDAVATQFRVVASYMQTGADIFIDGEPVQCGKKRGRLARCEEWVDIYQLKAEDSSYAPVRIDGIWMFDKYVGSGHGLLVFELKRSSIEALTSNRDGLKYQWSDLLEPIVEDLLVNKKSALRELPPQVYELVPGTGPVRVSAKTPSVDELDNLVRDAQGQFELAQAAARQLFGEGARSLDLSRVEQVVKTKRFLVEAMTFVGYEPDFIVRYTGNKYHAHNFMHTNKAKVIAKMWTETIKQVLLDNKQYVSFTCGFMFDDSSVDAEFVKLDDHMYFLLNPFSLLGALGFKGKPLSKRPLLMCDLRSRACHEVTHMFHRNHNEDFIAKFHEIEMRTWQSRESYNYIQKLT